MLEKIKVLIELDSEWLEKRISRTSYEEKSDYLTKLLGLKDR